MFTKKKPKPIKTWRIIRQPAFTRSATLLGWLRQAKKGLKLGLYVGLVFSLTGFFTWLAWHQPSFKSRLYHTSLAKGTPPKVCLKTDGALQEEHIQAALALPVDAGLLELDLQVLKQRISALAEVKSITLEKELPDKLHLYITEHRPMARVAFGDKEGKVRVLCMSEEGFIFQPSYRSKHLKTLPWLDGIKLKPRGPSGFESLPQLAFLAPLLQEARLAKPKLYAQFKSIQCSEIDACATAPWSAVRIRTRSWGEWVFATKDYSSQLERLDIILAELSTRHPKRVKTIDLSLEGQGLVNFF